MKYLLVVFLGLITLAVAAQSNVGAPEKNEKESILGALIQKPSKDQVLGEILKGVLENYHITKKNLNDSVSKNAFSLYLERIDYGKQFLVKK